MAMWGSAKTTTEARPEASRRPDIQGLRAIAVTLVVAFHAGVPLSGGFVGVDVFFVISGFVITTMLEREWLATGRIRFAHFYARRFRRLAPALALVIGVTLLLSTFVLSPLGAQQSALATGIGAMLFAANFAIQRTTGNYFDISASSNALLNTWSLAVEEQFYLVFPLILVLGWLLSERVRWFRGRRTAVVGIVAIVGIASFAVCSVTSYGIRVPLVPDTLIGFYGPLTRAWEFAAGALLALLANRLHTQSKAVSGLLAIAGLGVLAVSTLTFTSLTPFPGLPTLLPVLGAMLLIQAGAQPNNFISRAIGTRPFAAVGDFSYSWYLWHWPLIVFAAAMWPGYALAGPLAALASLIPAYLSFRFVERPIRNIRRIDRRRSLGLVAFTLAPTLAISAILALALGQGFWSPQVRHLQASQSMHVGYLAGCMTYVPMSDSSDRSCQWNKAATGSTIYLVGDSIAEHLSEAVIKAGKTLNRPVTIGSAASCSPYHVLLRLQKDSPTELTDVSSGGLSSCSSWVDGTIAWLEEQKPGLVILGASDVTWWNPSPDGVIPNLAGETTSSDEKAAALESAMRATVERLREAGHEVLIEKAPPSYRWPAPGWSPQECTLLTIVAHNCEKTVSLQEMDRAQRGTREVVDGVAKETGASILDTRDFFCPKGLCSTEKGSIELYHDDYHLSTAATKLLAPEVLQAIKRAG